MRDDRESALVHACRCHDYIASRRDPKISIQEERQFLPGRRVRRALINKQPSAVRAILGFYFEKRKRARLARRSASVLGSF